MMSRHLTFKYRGGLRTVFFKIRFCLSVTIRQRELYALWSDFQGMLGWLGWNAKLCRVWNLASLERHRSGDPSEQQTDIILETGTKPIAYRLGCSKQEEGAGGASVDLEIVSANCKWEDLGRMAAVCADLPLCHFHWGLWIPRGVGSGGSISSNDDEWFPGASPGSAAGTEPVCLCHTECHTAPRRPFYHLPVFVYFGSHLNCTESVSHPFSPEGGTPCCLFGSSDSFNFHLSSLPLFLLVLGSHLTALAG